MLVWIIFIFKYSTDGINWTYGAYTEDGNGGNYGNGTYYKAQPVDYVNNTFVALIRVETGLKLDTSTDGMNWIRTSTILTGLAWSPSCVGTAYGNGKYLAYGAGSDNMATDGITWTQGSGNGQNDDNVPWMLDGTIVESFVV